MFEHRTTVSEVLSLIPIMNWPFFSSLPLLSLNQCCVLNQVPSGGKTTFQAKNGHLADQLESSKLNLN